jgi:hypothetical protein
MKASDEWQRQDDERTGNVDYSRADRGLYVFRIYDKPPLHSRLDPKRDAPFSGERRDDPHNCLSREELRDHLDQLDGLPVLYEHRHGQRVGGVVVDKEMDPSDGSVDVFCRLFSDTPAGRELIWRVETKRDGTGASLSHDWDGQSRRFLMQEVSVCKKGMRDGTGYRYYKPDSTNRGMDAYRRTFRQRMPTKTFFKICDTQPRAAKPRTWGRPPRGSVHASATHPPLVTLDGTHMWRAQRKMVFRHRPKQGRRKSPVLLLSL